MSLFALGRRLIQTSFFSPCPRPPHALTSLFFRTRPARLQHSLTRRSLSLVPTPPRSFVSALEEASSAPLDPSWNTDSNYRHKQALSLAKERPLLVTSTISYFSLAAEQRATAAHAVLDHTHSLNYTTPLQLLKNASDWNLPFSSLIQITTRIAACSSSSSYISEVAHLALPLCNGVEEIATLMQNLPNEQIPLWVKALLSRYPSETLPYFQTSFAWTAEDLEVLAPKLRCHPLFYSLWYKQWQQRQERISALEQQLQENGTAQQKLELQQKELRSALAPIQEQVIALSNKKRSSEEQERLKLLLTQLAPLKEVRRQLLDLKQQERQLCFQRKSSTEHHEAMNTRLPQYLAFLASFSADYQGDPRDLLRYRKLILSVLQFPKETWRTVFYKKAHVLPQQPQLAAQCERFMEAMGDTKYAGCHALICAEAGINVGEQWAVLGKELAPHRAALELVNSINSRHSGFQSLISYINTFFTGKYDEQEFIHHLNQAILFSKIQQLPPQVPPHQLEGNMEQLILSCAYNVTDASAKYKALVASARDPFPLYIFASAKSQQPLVSRLYTSLLNGTLDEDRMNGHQHLDDLFQEQPTLRPLWMKGEVMPLPQLKRGHFQNLSKWTLEDTAKWDDLFLNTVEVNKSCLNFYMGYYRFVLLSLLLDGATRLLILRNAEKKVVGRHQLRLIKDKTTGGPALFIEPLYHDHLPIDLQNALTTFAKHRAAQLGLFLFEAAVDLGIPLEIGPMNVEERYIDANGIGHVSGKQAVKIRGMPIIG